MSAMRSFYALLWAVMMFTVARASLFSRRRDTAQFDTIDPSAMLQIAAIGIIMLALVILPRTRIVLGDLTRSSALIFLFYLLLALASAIWSENPPFTLFRSIEVLAIFLLTLVLISRSSGFISAERAVLWTLMAITLMSFLQRATQLGLSMEALHTNVYSTTAGMGFLYALAESFRATPERRARLRRWAVVFAFFLLIGTSVGSNLATLLGFLVMLSMLKVGRAILIPAAMVIFGFAALTGMFEQFLTATLFAGREVDDLTRMSGRDHLWDAYFLAISERPFTGYGFAVVSRIGEQFGTVDTTNAHNGFFEAILGMGIGGLALLVVYFIKLGFDLLKAYRAQAAGSIGATAAVAMLIVNNNSKSIVGGSFDPTMVGAFVLLAFAHLFVIRRDFLNQPDGDGVPAGQPLRGQVIAHSQR